MTPELLDEYLELTQKLDEAQSLLTASPDTRPTLLPHQIPPQTEDWLGWVLTGGRGVGKTKAGSQWISDLARSTPGLRGRIIAPTLSDAVNGVVRDPDSGIMAADPLATFHASGPEGVRLTWPNGATVWCVGTPTLKDVDRLRALTNIDVDLFEEAAANPQLAEAVKQASLSRRGSRLSRPLWIATTTPRPVPTLKEWIEDPRVHVTRATTFDNPYTPNEYRDYANSLIGTRAYRQEVLGEIVEDVEGALWRRQDLERSTVPLTPELTRTFTRFVVGVDPPAGMGTCGIVVAALAEDDHIYVIDDLSVSQALPHQWGSRVYTASIKYGDALVVAEKNQGGEMVYAVMEQIAPDMPVTTVTASVGKDTRAEPIALQWEAEHQTAHLAPATPGALDDLITQLTEWVPKRSPSPDRLDAMVWACAYFKRQRVHKAVFRDPTRSPIALPSSTSSFRKALRGAT